MEVEKMRRFTILMVLLFAVGLVSLAAPAYADKLHMACVAGDCSDGLSTLIISSSTTLTLWNTDGRLPTSGAETGTVFLGILVPNGTSIPVVSGNWTYEETKYNFTGGDLKTLLGESLGNMNDYNFSNFVSFSSQAGVVANSFTVSEYYMTGYYGQSQTSNVGNFKISGAPAGTVAVAWLEYPLGTVIEQTPPSASATIVPEPGILILLGIAMGAIGVASWRIPKL
jgi:hypothetical protein